ncbi:SDR family NAD(P)-dependent oxidoreductase [Ruegeria marina]|uniref:NAD(P)-dependent dehydrogenase, short-chain alcohol dehydrogenase family n=1 Tax=Ruegeria marina TaxID=639004 RepID=A0A1G6M044_9RHOB|nr:SDR family NAD(P)-dependent oxidoreductase [Ruegeria marina]SDC48664.1 NAD(P)-dependent dehydrogenase, short-chain alcohol dehydrogenase family [Ruegeria marina]
MENALVIGASGGIGRAVAAQLERLGVAVTRLSRSVDGFDLTDEHAVAAGLQALDVKFDLILVATGALEIGGSGPEKSVRALSARAMLDQFALNAVGPALVLRESARLLPRDRRAVFAALSARVGSIGDNRLGGWMSYRSAKAALNQIVRTGAIELARTHKQAICVSLHPGTVATAFTEKYLGRYPAAPPDEAASNLLRVIAKLTPAHSGGFYDWAGKEVPW